MFVCMYCKGNKSDLEDQRQVPFDDVIRFADQYDILHAIETSAKDNINIEEAFVEIARVLSSCFGSVLLSICELQLFVTCSGNNVHMIMIHKFY